MLCRLCLVELESFISIYNEDSKNSITEVADIINKYFQIDLKLNDPISTKICDNCWQQLQNFHQFYLMVNERQSSLVLKCETEPEPDIISAKWLTPEVHIMDMPKVAVALEEIRDVKDAILDEPEIDATLHSQHENDDDDDFANRSENSECDEQHETKHFDNDVEFGAAVESPVKNKLVTKKCKVNISMKSTTKKPVGRPSKSKKKTATPTLDIPQRRLRTRTNTSNIVAPATKLPPSPSSPERKPTDTLQDKSSAARETTETQLKKSETTKRGRPKGTRSKPKNQSTPIRTPEMLEQREKQRSIVREMDEFIAANVKLDCCLCGQALKDFKELKEHFRMQHKCNGYVRCCNNRYNKRSIYVDHLHLHRDPEYFRCKLCKKNYHNRNSYEMHILRFHTDKQKLINECDICGQRFAKVYLLTMHKKNHKGKERPEVCQMCNKTFRTPFELKAHVKRMHDETFEPVICDICGSHFRNETNFAVHKQTVHREGPPEPEVQCHLCGRWVRDRHSLRRHIARHKDGSSTYKCDQCDEVKLTRAALYGHIRYHHTDKRHSCTLCGKEFKIPRNLKEHMATHTGIDLYACQFCPRTFKSHANMHNHKKKMHFNDWVPKYSVPGTAGPNTAAQSTLATDSAVIESLSLVTNDSV